ncbi:MAG TPA: NAD-dependent epimerase/dehydratase family protein [Pseudomonadales bacterium]
MDAAVLQGVEEASQREPGELGYCLVTGGAGYLGQNLTRELLRRGVSVRIFDQQRADFTHEALDVVQGDVRDFEAVRRACEGIDTVFHTAAVMSFLGLATRAQREESFGINVRGVANIIRACRAARVRRLIYTSTNNVTFGGPVIDGDESHPYADNPKDLYTQTKILGEKLALEANDREGLLTCAIRPGGIYGPNDRLIVTRLANDCARGMIPIPIGDGTAKSDNTFIDNLVDGQIEAARHLAPDSPVCGQAYFITDGVSLNYFDFFQPFVEELGHRYPKLRLPAAPLYALAATWEFLHWAVKVPPPLFTRLELRKMTVSHYNRIDKAQRDFGWQPKVSLDEASRACIAYLRDYRDRHERVDRPHWGWWVAILSGMALLAMLAFHPPAHAAWTRSVTTWTPRWLLQGVFVWAVLLHVYKGMKAVRTAERADLRETSMAWGWQTFALGFASLGLLEKRIAGHRDRVDGDWARIWVQRAAGNRWLSASTRRAHRWLYTRTKGRVGHAIGDARFLLLHHTDRATGRTGVTPLAVTRMRA